MTPGEAYWIESELERRPGIVLSREKFNRGDYVMMVLCTTQKLSERSQLRNCVPINAGEFGFSQNCVVQCEYVSTVERDEIDVDSGFIGKLDEERMRAVVRAIGYVIEAECEPE